VIKVWDLDTTKKPVTTPTTPDEPTLIQPSCLRTIKIQHNEKPFPITTFATVENMAQMAVGLANGTVLLYRLDLLKDKATKPKVIYEGQEPITGKEVRMYVSIYRYY
jgi:hypothetical protein